MRFKIVKFSELGDSWLPSDHILETQLDDLTVELKKRQAVLYEATLKAVKLQEDITALAARISSKGYRPSQRVAQVKKT